MAARNSKRTKRKTRLERAMDIVNQHDFGVLTAGEWQNRIESGNEHPDDINDLLRDTRDILSGKHGRDALDGFRQRIFEIMQRTPDDKEEVRHG